MNTWIILDSKAGDMLEVIKKIIRSITSFSLTALRSFLNFFLASLGDFFILAGLLTVIITTFQINTIIGSYLLGVVLFGMGIYFSIMPVKKGGDSN